MGTDFQYSCIPFEMFALCCAVFGFPIVEVLIFSFVSSESSLNFRFPVIIVISFIINIGKDRKIVKCSRKIFVTDAG